MEQSRGDIHNLLVIVRAKFNCSVSEALEWAHQHHRTLEHHFFETKVALPSFGADTDRKIAHYIDGLGNWVRASDAWSFESGRYFGSKGLEVQKTRRVKLLPKRKLMTHLHKENVEVPLIDSLKN